MRASTHSNTSAFAANEKVGESSIRRWKKELETNPELFGANKNKANCGKRLKYPDLEEFLIKWFNTISREKKFAVTYSMLQSQAIKFCQNQNYSDISISKGFIYKFVHRNKIVRRKITHYSQKDSSQLTQAIENFRTELYDLK